VAVIDSGIAPLATFGNRIRAFYDFTRGGIATTPRDEYGHGTHVAATIGGSGSPYGSSYTGIAPEATFVGLKVLDANGQGYTTDVIDAIAFAIANKKTLDIDIINLSLGHAPYESAKTDPLVRAVDQAAAAGIVVVVSAGNVGINPSTGRPGYGGITSPGNARSAITVGASETMGTVSRDDDLIGPFSSRGPTWIDGYAKPDLVAPGHKIVQLLSTTSTLNTLYPTLRVGTGNSVSQPLSLTGTSMSAAATSGVVARMINAAAPRKLTPNLTKAILQYSTTILKNEQQVPYDRMTQGAGELNSNGAVTLTRAINPSAALNAYWLTTSFAPSTIYAGAVVPWAQNVIWGENLVWGDSIAYHLHAYDNVVWGDNLVWGENLIWGENLVWGDNIVWSVNIVWGDNVVWGDNLIWGENIVWSVNIVWGDNVVWGENLVWGENVVWGESDLSASEGGDTGSGGDPVDGGGPVATEP
jgi:serine protease AprX